MFSHYVAKLINLLEADPEIGEHVIAELEWAYLLMLPTRDPSLLAGGATVLDDAALAALV
jgi:hypothetical protein